GLPSAAALSDATGARLAWVPRRAGERGAVEAGCLPGLLPGGRPVTDADARRALADLWRSEEPPAAPGRDTEEILCAAATGEIGALLVAGVEAADLPDPEAALAAVDSAGFVVSLELRRSEITDRADVVLPIAPVAEKAGTFLTWEGRERPFDAALTGTDAMPDLRVLNALAEETGAWFGLPDVESARREFALVTERAGAATTPPRATTTSPARSGHAADPSAGEAGLGTWRMLRGCRRKQDGDTHPAGTARHPAGDRRGRGRAGDRLDRPGRDHAPLRRDRHARPGGVAAAELARLRGGRHPRDGGRGDRPARTRSADVMSTPAADLVVVTLA